MITKNIPTKSDRSPSTWIQRSSMHMAIDFHAHMHWWQCYSSPHLVLATKTRKGRNWNSCFWLIIIKSEWIIEVFQTQPTDNLVAFQGLVLSNLKLPFDRDSFSLREIQNFKKPRIRKIGAARSFGNPWFEFEWTFLGTFTTGLPYIYSGCPSLPMGLWGPYPTTRRLCRLFRWRLFSHFFFPWNFFGKWFLEQEATK